ncbi:MAG: hypothetical protein M3N53_07795 [Actinomycetota bacterium]|nr:hypothetical protein [Actinomycetota bacterium]
MRVGLLLVIGTLGVSGCGVSGETGGGYQPPAGGGAAPTTAGPDEPVSVSPAPGSSVHDLADGRERVTPRPGMANLRKVPWESFLPKGATGLDLKYWSGVEPCNVLDHVEVEEDQKRVVVTLFEGSDPQAKDVACIELAVLKVVRVELDRPLGGRKIFDGAK